MARQNNTPALLMAHNGLAKLLKNNWPWLLGGVVDAPRLLSRLCEIYRDGLDQASQYTPRNARDPLGRCSLPLFPMAGRRRIKAERGCFFVCLVQRGDTYPKVFRVPVFCMYMLTCS